MPAMPLMYGPWCCASKTHGMSEAEFEGYGYSSVHVQTHAKRGCGFGACMHLLARLLMLLGEEGR